MVSCTERRYRYVRRMKDRIFNHSVTAVVLWPADSRCRLSSRKPPGAKLLRSRSSQVLLIMLVECHFISPLVLSYNMVYNFSTDSHISITTPILAIHLQSTARLILHSQKVSLDGPDSVLPNPTRITNPQSSISNAIVS